MAKFPNGVRKRFKTPRKPERDQEVFNLLRLMRGRTTMDLAREAGLAHSTVSKLRCRTTRWPRWHTARVLAEACGYVWCMLPADDALVARARRRKAKAQATGMREQEPHPVVH